MPKFLQIAGRLVRRVGRMVFSPCVDCCDENADKTWLRACSCVRWTPSGGATCAAVHEYNCIWICLGAFLSDDTGTRIAERIAEIRAAFLAGTPFVVFGPGGQCYQIRGDVYDAIPDGETETFATGVTVNLATGCDDEDCVAEPTGDTYVVMTKCDPTQSGGSVYACRSRQPAEGLRSIGGTCYCVTWNSATSSSVPAGTINNGVAVANAVCCDCLNGRVNSGTFGSANPCPQTGGGSSPVCASGDIKNLGGAVLERCCCGECGSLTYTISGFSWSGVGGDGTAISWALTSQYQSDSAGNPDPLGQNVTIILTLTQTTGGVTTVTTGLGLRVPVGCGGPYQVGGPSAFSGAEPNIEPFPTGAPIWGTNSDGVVSGNCSIRTFAASVLASGSAAATITVSGTIGRCAGCGGA